MSLQAAAPCGLPGPKARILLIDDSRFARCLFTAVFRELGYEATTAAEGEEGIRLASECGFDVIVVDGMLPNMDGIEVCRRLGKLPGEKPILLLFTASRRLYQERFSALQDGIDGYLQKDSLGEALVARVEELLQARAAARERYVA